MTQEKGYLELLQHILDHGEERHGRNGRTLAIFGARLEFDLRRGFPLLTTKRVFWRGIVEELLWFLRGSTDARELAAKNVHIWDGNSSREYLDSRGLQHYAEGELGTVYGWQWRNFGGTFALGEDGRRADFLKDGKDQIRYVLEQLASQPHGRRAVLSAWNPLQAHMMALEPCHVLYQFYVSNAGGLSCQVYCRSQDTMAGTPFNIGSTALLTTLLAKCLGLEPERVILVAGDTHIYDAHIAAAKEQVERVPYEFPTIEITKDINPSASITEKLGWLESLTFDDIKIHDYKCHPPIKIEMVV
jgi:thymidylate synthase